DDGVDNTTGGAGAAFLFSFTDGAFSGGTLEATIGKGYTGGKNVDVSALESSDSFGQSVALNAAGDRLAVGAYGDDGNNNSASMSGAVYLFTSGTETGSYPVESGAAFAAHGDQSISVSAADLRSKLSLGQNITLQASNDITLSSDINVVGSAANGGDLTLRAGRSILLNASLVTNDGNLTLFANDTLANGVVDRHRDTGNAEISMAAGTSIDTGSGAVSITLLDGAGKTNSGSGNISLRNITAGTITAVNSGPTTGSGITLSSGALAASGSGDAIVLSGQSFTNTAGASALSAGSGRWLVWSSNADPFDGGTGDTRGGLAYNFKQYNATYNNSAVAQSTGNGLLYTLAPTLNSSLIGTATKTYDGLSSITTLTAGNYSAATGAVDGDTLSLTTPTTGTLGARNVGNNINVSVTRAKDSWTNGSAAVYGYQVAQSSGNIAAITTKALTISGPSIADKSYDGTPRAGALTKGALSGLVGNETLTVTASAANLSSETVGNYTTTVRYALANGTNGGLASNYSLADTAGVTARIIKLSKSDEAILISTSGVVSETYKSRTEVGVCMSDLSKDLEANAARTTTGDKDRLNYDLNPTLLNNKFNQRCQRNLSLIKIPENSLDNGFLNRELR
ncbi:MAG: beta strand repeat-containing protein, partial [Paracoccaceae bacterium]